MDKIIQTRFSDPELERMLTASFALITEKIRLRAETLGKRNLLLVSGNSIGPHFEDFFHDCQQLIDFVESRLQFRTTCFEVSETDQAAAEQTRPIDNEIIRAKDMLIPVDAELKNTHVPTNRNRVKHTHLAIFIICALDAVSTFSAFQQWGYSYIDSIIIGCLFGAVLGIFSHLVPYFINKGKTIGQKKMIAATIFIAMTILFGFFAFTRAHFLSSINGGFDGNAWAFIVISDFLFVTAVGVYLKYMPTKAEREAIQRYDALVVQKDVITSKIAMLEQSITDLERQRLALRFSNSSIVVYGNTIEKRIVHFAQREFSHLKNELLMYTYRSDGVVPNWFYEKFPFTFTLYFNSID